jgi:NADH:ubiquinone oxidoreductase subunit 5 (subunit L)/multisubunit Na+/H+ antiporter MnhA subunit
MGGFFKLLPFETLMTLIGLINLGGLPFSFGFFIKHYTLLSLFDVSNLFIKVNLLIGMFSGLIYSYRLYYYVFFDVRKAKKTIYTSASKVNLKSKLYSNTTLASTLAITLLLIISITVIAYMYICFFYSFGINKNMPYWSIHNKTIYLVINANESSNLIGSYINWFILIIGAILLIIKFRYQLYYYALIDKINFIILTLFFIFGFLAL